MMGQPFILPLVAFEDLVPVVVDTAQDIVGFTTHGKCSLNHCKFLVMADILGINRIEIAFAQAKIVNGIKQVCFSHAIFAHETIDPGRESYFSFRNVFEIYE
jgi:hypothetical protein